MKKQNKGGVAEVRGYCEGSKLFFFLRTSQSSVFFLSQVNLESCVHWYVFYQLLTCCVVKTGSSVDPAGLVFYQLVCAPVVKQRMSGTGPLL